MQTDLQPCSALIAGAGPCGLAAALMLLERGWSDIVIVERRAAPDEFERGKAFNYQLDGRGQRILATVGIGPERLQQYGLPNDHFTQVTFNADGSSSRMSFPALLPDRKTPYWMTRANLLEMLQTRLHEQNTDGRVAVHYGTSLAALSVDEQGALNARLDNPDTGSWIIRPPLILGCDGLKSAVSAQLMQLSPADPSDFAMTVYPSPSAELGYKVLRFPPSIPVKGHDSGANDHRLAYWFTSAFKDRKRKMALVALPVPHPSDGRNINIILHRSHSFWTLQHPEEIREFLTRGFPQLDFTRLLPDGELDGFAQLPTGTFPDPQHANRLHYAVENAGTSADCLLLGDAAHAFPPDLGMGVNAALEDVYVLREMLDRHNGDSHKACLAFETARLPENAALVRLVQTVHPYQYNQVPWRLKLWFLKFFCQSALT
ncbi:MAG: NAD(P)/FAD-dependent oxidoreductase, partial [Chromatocurvus sp.]